MNKEWRFTIPDVPNHHTKPFQYCYLDVWHGQSDQEVHEDDADEDNEEKDHEVPGEREYCVSVLVDEILVLDFPRHHDQSLNEIILELFTRYMWDLIIMNFYVDNLSKDVYF